MTPIRAVSSTMACSGSDRPGGTVERCHESIPRCVDLGSTEVPQLLADTSIVLVEQRDPLPVAERDGSLRGRERCR